MNLSVIIIAKNEEQMLPACLDSVKDLAGEIVIIDDNSDDKTGEIAGKYTDKIYNHPRENFALQRSFGLEKVTGDWILYLDADERLSPGLSDEIRHMLKSQHSMLNQGYLLPRQNYYFGTPWPKSEKIPRLFKRSALKGWRGEVHESPVLENAEGAYGCLKNPLLHFTHRDIGSMLEKTISWSETEADLRFKARHPPVVWWRFFRVMAGEFWKYYVKEGGWKAGTVGIIESMYQAFSIFITYARLYEMQQKNSLEH